MGAFSNFGTFNEIVQHLNSEKRSITNCKKNGHAFLNDIFRL